MAFSFHIIPNKNWSLSIWNVNTNISHNGKREKKIYLSSEDHQQVILTVELSIGEII